MVQGTGYRDILHPAPETRNQKPDTWYPEPKICNHPKPIPVLHQKHPNLTPTDEELIRQSIQQDQAAYRQLVERYQDFVYTVVYRMLRNREEAEEVAMDVFLKAFRTLHHYGGRSKFSTWLYSIAYRSAIDKLRLKKRSIQSLDDAFMSHTLVLEEASPLEKAEQLDLQQVLQKVIQLLPAEDAGLVSLYYLQELSIKEVAKSTGLSVSNVKVKLFRLRSELKSHIKHLLKEEIDDLFVQ